MIDKSSPNVLIMKNYASIMRIGAFMRLFDNMEKNFRRADNRDVKDALDVMKYRRDMGPWWHKKKETKFSMGIPNSWAFSPAMSRLGLETMSEEEKRDFITAYRRRAPKLSA